VGEGSDQPLFAGRRVLQIPQTHDDVVVVVFDGGFEPKIFLSVSEFLQQQEESGG